MSGVTGEGQDWSVLLGEAGALARALPQFRAREQQQAMAAQVAHTLRDGGVALIEAGTGTGKTFAYLLPAMLSGRKVLVSTGSKALQDQILEKDIPLLLRAMGKPLRVSRLKGRANYLCRHRLQRFSAEGVAPALVAPLARVADWAGRTREGDVSELTSVPEDSPIWPLVTSTRDNCPGSECPEYGRCHVIEARRQAQEAEILVVNHHLLFSDLALKANGMGDLLPRVDAMVLDEAHQVLDLAGRYFGQHLSSHQLWDWGRDSRAETLAEAGDDEGLLAAAAQVETQTTAWRTVLGPGDERGSWALNPDSAEGSAFARLRQAVAELGQALNAAAARGKGLEQCAARGVVLLATVDFFAAHNAPNMVFWQEKKARTVQLHATPLDVAAPLQRHLLEPVESVILTSATLRVGDSFASTERALGLTAVSTLTAASPFDYARQSLLYLPPLMPEPGHPSYTRACLDAAAPVIEASGGRTFFLFTSHRALQEAAVSLPQRLSFPILVQGSMPRPRLLDRFRSLGNAVLLGAASFWEGVDVQGEALSCVIIDKLPFANPSDPILRARTEQCQAAGGDPFRELQIPQAVIALRQGVGRLIRSEMDRGVLMLCDPRLRSKGYGRIFLDSLPPMRRVSSLDAIHAFWRGEA
ncbi:ATP-dependent DNA helicase [Acidithiobacillus ferrooxidans]|nr:ATP-dependent DNA helicase [Acidithiobacillus ferrooxidans]MBU2859718.1 ATP-dependent DNA helicase [Acidithiobacillus ferrooxidans]